MSFVERLPGHDFVQSVAASFAITALRAVLPHRRHAPTDGPLLTRCDDTTWKCEYQGIVMTSYSDGLPRELSSNGQLLRSFVEVEPS